MSDQSHPSFNARWGLAIGLMLTALVLVAGLILTINFWPKTDQRTPAQAQADWQALNITSYTIQVRETSLWADVIYQVRVVDGVVVEKTVICPTDSPYPPEVCEPYRTAFFEGEHYTVAGIFSRLIGFQNNYSPEYARVTYHPTYHFPSEVIIDVPDIIDEEVVWRVITFTP